MGNNVLLYRLLKEGRYEEFREAVTWWLNASRAYTIKLVSGGGDGTLEGSAMPASQPGRRN